MASVVCVPGWNQRTSAPIAIACRAMASACPSLDALEPKWVHCKHKVVEPDGDPLGAYEIAERVCRVFDCPHYERLSIPENAA
jgi:hypothetical protein